MTVGSPVRVIRMPHFGSLGEVVDLPPELRLVESEAKVRVLRKSVDARDLTGIAYACWFQGGLCVAVVPGDEMIGAGRPDAFGRPRFRFRAPRPAVRTARLRLPGMTSSQLRRVP
jgi:hypothetical protein